MTKYKIIYGERINVQERIEIHMGWGWKCQGGVSVSALGECVQAITYTKYWWQFWKEKI